MIKKFPKIMAVVNVTPDSFSDGGQFYSFDKAVDHALELIDDGADIIDIGGESTRPGAAPVDEAGEASRVVPVVESIKKLRPGAVISVDTTKLGVARAAAGAGAVIINDISGLQMEPGLAALAAENGMGLVIMHIQGAPRTMQVNPHYEDVVREVYSFLEEKIDFARQAGVKNIIADTGIGFGKTLGHNLELLRRHEEFSRLGVPMLLGISRKSFIGKITGIDSPAERDLPTALIHALLINSGAGIIRVHNVKMIKMLKDLWISLFGGNNL